MLTPPGFRSPSLSVWSQRLNPQNDFHHGLLGFEFDRQAAGSHEIWYNPGANRYTTIPNHPGDLPEGTLRAILKQAGIAQEELLRAN
jgi:predicted RNA binding protein YcfA (HicA-like mRNA interferase family)